jgi:sulfhydrogenase subunit gamma (sulfur reductase)
MKLQEKDPELYLPEKVRITKVEQLTPSEKLFVVEPLESKSIAHDPGQFFQVSLLGIGEAPISISSAPGDGKTFDLSVRAVGNVTNAMHNLDVGDEFYIRGPFGHGFDKDICERLIGKKLLFIAGGCGYAPLRSLINMVIAESKDYKSINILYGCKTSHDRMYTNELEEISHMGGNIELLETVDNDDETWKGNVGLITTLIPKVEIDPEETIAIIVGPPIMYKFVLQELLKRDVKKENIYMSLERHMKCGIGKCGHCQMENVYTCQEGPVFRYSDVVKNEEII